MLSMIKSKIMEDELNYETVTFNTNSVSTYGESSLEDVFNLLAEAKCLTTSHTFDVLH